VTIAATADPRFYPLKEDELADLDISVDVLGVAEEVKDLDELDPKRYGIIIRSLDGRRRGPLHRDSLGERRLGSPIETPAVGIDDPAQ